MKMAMLVIVLCLVITITSFAQAPTPAVASVPVANGPTAVQRKALIITTCDVSGNPIGDLKREEISIVDSGQAATTLAVRKAGDLPLDLAIVLYADKRTFSQQQAAAINLVKSVIRPDRDHAFVVSAGGSKGWLNPQIQWQSDADTLTKSIEGLNRDEGLGDPFGFDFDRSATGMGRNTIQHFGPKDGNNAPSVFSVVWQMMASDARPVRKVVIIVRDAWAHSPGFSSRYTPMIDEYLQQVIGNAQMLGVTLYVIGLEDQTVDFDTNIGEIYVGMPNAPSSAAKGGADENFLKVKKAAYAGGRSNVERMAESTGGHVWWALKKNYTDATEGIAKTLASQYVLFFTPSSAQVENPRGLTISLGRKDARLGAPNAYYLPKVQ